MNEPKQDPSPESGHDIAALRTALEQLRLEGNALRAQHPEKSARTDRVLTELEQELNGANSADLQDALRHRVQTAMREFEGEHAGFTTALGQFLAALGNMGI